MRDYQCGSAGRRADVLESPLNGIDYVEVVDSEAPRDSSRQHTLLVRCLKTIKDPALLTADNILLENRPKHPQVMVTWAYVVSKLLGLSTADSPVTPAERTFLRQQSEPDHVIAIRTDSTGDFSTYKLHLVASRGGVASLDGFDPCFASVSFSFKVECPQWGEPITNLRCPAPDLPDAPSIDYLAKDYASFRRLMIDRLAALMPDWREHPADLFTVLTEVLAYAGDYLSYYQDAVATEAYLGTARQRIAVRRHARLLDYSLHEGCNARVWVHVAIDNDADDNVSVPFYKGTQLWVGYPELPTCIKDTSSKYEEQHDKALTFETMYDVTLLSAHNRIQFHTWGEDEYCLAKGATSATLKGQLNFKRGCVLIFEEEVSPQSGLAQHADLTHRHAIRVTSFDHAEDPLGIKHVDAKTGVTTYKPLQVTNITWADEDALPFCLCVSTVISAATREAWLKDAPCASSVAKHADEEGSSFKDALTVVGVAHGNIVLADHGQTQYTEKTEDLELQTKGTGVALLLPKQHITWCTPSTLTQYAAKNGSTDGDTESGLPTQGVTAAVGTLLQEPLEALPAVMLYEQKTPWIPQHDLLNSDRFHEHFVVETDNDQRAFIRFGDDVYGKRPMEGDFTRIQFRVGNGTKGNIGADAIKHIILSAGRDDIGVHQVAVRNPLPARGGIDPEPREQVQLYAPYAFRSQGVPTRAVTPSDYAAAAETHPAVQKARANLQWTGSWYTVFIAVDCVGGRELDSSLKSELRTWIERFRLAGHDVEFTSPHFAALDIVLRVCVARGVLRNRVRDALLELFSNRVLPDGTKGFFHPDRFSFGVPVRLQDVKTWINKLYSCFNFSKEAVRRVEATTFRRWGSPPHGEIEAGIIDVTNLEIIRLDNDPNTPWNGTIEFDVEGGV